jgi:DnaJ-class molecular chaperone
MEIKAYIFLLIVISAIALIYLTLGSVNQVDPEINIINLQESKGITSNDISKGLIKTKCENCNGEGVIECPECKGSGEIVKSTDCKTCGGSGKIYRNHTILDCLDCNDGKIVETRTCEACNGIGWIKCPLCDGKGVV